GKRPGGSSDAPARHRAGASLPLPLPGERRRGRISARPPPLWHRGESGYDVAAMRIGILKADSVLPSLRAFGEYPDMFQSVLRAADPGLAFDAFDVEHGEYPGDLDACDGYLITGSRHSVYDSLPWIPPLEDFVRR